MRNGVAAPVLQNGMVKSGTRNWEQAYSNVKHVVDSASYPPLWHQKSSRFREELQAQNRFTADVRYGSAERNLLDLVLPQDQPRGLIMFVHGGYWLRFDKSYFTHLAQGAVAHGFAVAIPSYTLCPQASIPQITSEIAMAIIQAASMVEGPLHLAGHSAGGHLVARMATTTTPLNRSLQQRLRKIVPISAVTDLRPLLNLEMNKDFRLDLEQARLESPVLQEPLAGTDITTWVGAEELPEFVRQSRALANLWSGFDVRIDQVEEPDRHHMNILDGLEQADHPLTRKLLCL
ncbi:alpha/beta hydrolase [Pseudochrobactrum asaccharolyticum]|uniref:Acetyl esterase/lipase n=1 Tax=Pseudochrobactrum asaccharolyticum TaxID=354351 RepID=A0A366E0U4_9HYPH|nr:alpha/beta hydrolase [Pseudochrobactrum asaccharolyticum]RBO95933.1 acetyl esterase/lipase [Pseudochrobactrum asaccharolyticum]